MYLGSGSGDNLRKYGVKNVTGPEDLREGNIVFVPYMDRIICSGTSDFSGEKS